MNTITRRYRAPGTVLIMQRDDGGRTERRIVQLRLASQQRHRLPLAHRQLFADLDIITQLEVRIYPGSPDIGIITDIDPLLRIIKTG